jgi:Uma2 family endonuclease
MRLRTTRAGEGFDRRAFSVDEIQRMTAGGILSEDEPIELIEGEIIARPSKDNAHELIKGELVRGMVKAVPEDLRIGIETSLYLSDRTFVEPDLVLYTRRILPEDVRGPDALLIVVVADASMPFDLGVKARLYARHGVPELWVVDAVKRRATIHRAPFDGEWTFITMVGPDAALTHAALPDWSARLADLR